MKRIPDPWLRLLLASAFVVVAAGGGGISIAPAQTADPKGDVIRPEVRKPLQAAQELMTANKFQEALASIREAENVADRTPYENFFIDRMRAAAAGAAGDLQTAAKALEAVVASGRLTPAEQLKMAEGLAGTYFRVGDYPKAIVWATRYFKEGGADPQIRALLIRSYYLANDFARAATELRADLDADEKAGAVPSLDRLQLLATCYVKLNDAAGYDFALQKLLTYHPKKEYWLDAIRRVQTRPGFAERLALDVLRLLEATGNLNDAEQYTAMAQLALQAGLPAEAKRVVDKGFASGVLGTGAGAELQRRLRDTATKQAADDDRTFAQSAKDAAAAKDGTALVNVGLAMVGAGQIEKGLVLMEQGVSKGGVKRSEDARLHLGIAYAAAGDKAKAAQVFKTVQDAEGTADLARLWMIHLQRSSI